MILLGVKLLSAGMSYLIKSQSGAGVKTVKCNQRYHLKRGHQMKYLHQCLEIQIQIRMVMAQQVLQAAVLNQVQVLNHPLKLHHH